MEKYPILQSGFVSLVQTGLVKPKPTENLMIQRLLFKDHLVSNIENFYFEEVTNLYDLYRGEPTLLKDFDFRERILTTAMRVFGTDSIRTWLNHQNKTANLSLLHKQFIDETLEFICGWNNQERRTQTAQWIRLIEIATHKQSEKLDIDQWFVKDKYGYGPKLPPFLPDFLGMWVSRYNGFEDLLMSLYIIFGNRPYITNVREKNR